MKSDFALRMGLLRQETGLSQRQVAEALGISQALLSHYENGAREPKFEFVSVACAFYKVTSDYLLGYSNERKSRAQVLSEKVQNIVKSLEQLREAETRLLNELKSLVVEEYEEQSK